MMWDVQPRSITWRSRNDIEKWVVVTSVKCLHFKKKER